MTKLRRDTLAISKKGLGTNLLSAVLFLLLAGCSNSTIERVPVSGQVLIDGKPLAKGTLRVVPTGARPAYGKLDGDGRFTLMTYKPGDGVSLGTHSVSINAGEQVGANAVRWHAPPKYAEHNSSGIVLKVDSETDSAVINLTWDGDKPFVQSFGKGGGE